MCMNIQFTFTYCQKRRRPVIVRGRADSPREGPVSLSTSAPANLSPFGPSMESGQGVSAYY